MFSTTERSLPTSPFIIPEMRAESAELLDCRQGQGRLCRASPMGRGGKGGKSYFEKGERDPFGRFTFVTKKYYTTRSNENDTKTKFANEI